MQKLRMTGSKGSRVSVQAAAQARPAQGCKAVSPAHRSRDAGPATPASASSPFTCHFLSEGILHYLQAPAAAWVPLLGERVDRLEGSFVVVCWPSRGRGGTRGAGQSPLWIPALKRGGGGKSFPWSGVPTNPLFFCPQSSSQAALWPLLASSPCGTSALTPCILPP